MTVKTGEFSKYAERDRSWKTPLLIGAQGPWFIQMPKKTT